MNSKERSMVLRETAYLLDIILEESGCNDITEYAMYAMADSVALGVCLNCESVTEVEPDQDAGYCECCGQKGVASAFVLMGIM